MTLSPDLLDLRYRGGGHVESWFLKANEPGGARAILLQNKVFARANDDPDAAPIPPMAEAWAMAFDRKAGPVATKTAVPLARARFARGTLDVEVDGCELSLGRARGTLAGGNRRLTWDLAIGPERATPIVHSHAALYESRFATAKLVTPIADARVSGFFEVDRGAGEPAERWAVDGWHAMIGHTWGSAHPRVHAWVHCSAWENAEDLVLQAVSTRIRMGPVLSPLGTAVFVRWKGRAWDLDARELIGTNRGSFSLRRWEVSATGPAIEVRAELAAETDDFVGLHYPNPSGEMTFCLATTLARARLELVLPGEAPLVATSRAGALEIATRDPQHGVRMYL